MTECNCLLTLCGSCHQSVLLCQLPEHCETDCRAGEIQGCIACPYNGCSVVLTRSEIRKHISTECIARTRLSDICCRLIADTTVTPLNAWCRKHCDSCIMAVCTDPTGCPVVVCPEGCGVRLHSCKLVDHLDGVCSATEVACTCRSIGCDMRMARHKLAAHLRLCPANVLCCGVAWERDVSSWKLYQACLDEDATTRRWRRRLQQHLEQRANCIVSSDLSEALVLRDQLQLCRSMSRLFGSLRYRCALADAAAAAMHVDHDNSNLWKKVTINTPENPDVHSIMGRSTANINKHRQVNLFDFEQPMIEPDSDSSDLNYLEFHDDGTDDDDKDEMEEGTDKEDYSWVDEECRVSAKTSINWSVPFVGYCRRSHTGSGSSSSSASWTGHQFRFQCGQLVARADWAQHYQEHCDLRAALTSGAGSEHVERRCPLAGLGCRFSVMQATLATTAASYHSDREQHCVVYHPRLDCYGSSWHYLESPPDNQIQNRCPLLALPMELLENVLGRLDGLSVRMVAAAHPRLAQVARFLPAFRCDRPEKLVVLQWKHSVQSGGWRAEPHVLPWPPANYASSHSRLVPVFGTSAALNRHFASCPHRLPRCHDPDDEASRQPQKVIFTEFPPR